MTVTLVGRATVLGLRAAAGNGRLVATLWLANLTLALAAGFPIWRALADAIGPLPLADPMADAFSASVLADLSELRPGLVAGLRDTALALFGIGLVVGLLTSAGSLEVLTSRDARPFAHRFGRGAFRFFARFLRLGVITLVVALVAGGLVGGPLIALSRRLRRESGSEWLALAVLGLALVAAGIAVLTVLLLQDAARVRIVREDPRRVLPVLRGVVGLVLRRPAAWLGTWAVNGVLLLLAFAAYLALAQAVPAARLLPLVILLQQLFVLTRCGLRVALLGAEVSLVEALLPPPAHALAPQPMPAPAVEARSQSREEPPPGTA